MNIVPLHVCLSSAFALLLLETGCAVVRSGSLHPVAVQCEGQANALGVGARPQLGWLLESNQRAQTQSAYQVQVASSPSALRDA